MFCLKLGGHVDNDEPNKNPDVVSYGEVRKGASRFLQ